MVLLAAACGGGAGADPGEMTGTVLDPPFVVSATPLVDDDGEAYTLTDSTDKPLTLVFFGYTSCPDICGQVMATLAGTLTRLTDEQKDELDVVLISSDPHRDTRQVMSDYVRSYDPSIIGLTGDLDDIREVAASVKVAIGYFDLKGRELDSDDLPPGGYDVEHGTQIFAINADDEVDIFWGADVSQAQLTRDVTILLDEG